MDIFNFKKFSIGSRSYTFLKMQQSNKISILETVAFMRDSAHTICDVCDKQTRHLFSAAPF